MRETCHAFVALHFFLGKSGHIMSSFFVHSYSQLNFLLNPTEHFGSTLLPALSWFNIASNLLLVLSSKQPISPNLFTKDGMPFHTLCFCQPTTVAQQKHYKEDELQLYSSASSIIEWLYFVMFYCHRNFGKKRGLRHLTEIVPISYFVCITNRTATGENHPQENHIKTRRKK